MNKPTTVAGLLFSTTMSVFWATALVGCGEVSPKDIVGTWVYEEGTTVTLDCDSEDVDGTYNLEGQTLTFQDGKGTPYDLVMSVAPGCDVGYNLEDSDIVLATTLLEGCYPDTITSALLSPDFKLTYDGKKILLSGTTTVEVVYYDDPEGLLCEVTLDGALVKQ